MGMFYHMDRRSKDAVEASKWYRLVAEQGYLNICTLSWFFLWYDSVWNRIVKKLQMVFKAKSWS